MAVFFSNFSHSSYRKCTLSEFAEDTELGRMADTPESCVPFSETCKGWRADYRGNLGYSTNILNADKCRALHLGRNNCTDHQYRLRTELLEENSSDRGLGVLTDHEPAVCPWCKGSHGILGCIKKCGQEVEGSDPPPLLYSRVVTSEIVSRSLLASSRKTRNSLRVNWRATKLIRGWEHLAWGKAETWDFWAWRRSRRDLTQACKYLKGECQDNGVEFFSVVPSDRTRGNRHKLEQRNFHLNMRKNFFSFKGDRALENAAQRCCEVFFSGYIKNIPWHFPVQTTLGNLLQQVSWTRRYLEVPSNSTRFCDCVKLSAKNYPMSLYSWTICFGHLLFTVTSS